MGVDVDEAGGDDQARGVDLGPAAGSASPTAVMWVPVIATSARYGLAGRPIADESAAEDEISHNRCMVGPHGEMSSEAANPAIDGLSRRPAADIMAG